MAKAVEKDVLSSSQLHLRSLGSVKEAGSKEGELSPVVQAQDELHRYIVKKLVSENLCSCCYANSVPAFARARHIAVMHCRRGMLGGWILCVERLRMIPCACVRKE